VGYGGRSDAELLELSKAGVAPAFAVLLHRHGSAVRSAVDHDPDPTGAVVETFVRAMRELSAQDGSTLVRPWLLSLAGADATPDPIVPLGEEERDEVWAELAVRWPTGRVPRHHDLLQRLALVAGLVAISALVPTLILLADQQESEPLEELRAFPLQAAVEVAEPDEAEPLPAFTFPTVPELEDPAPGPTEPVGTPTPTSTPAPAATATEPATPAPSPTATPGPAPSPTPTSSETDATGGDGDGGDQDGGDGGEPGEETVLPAPPGDPPIEPPGGTVDE
jgi:hypothetical protein